MAKEKAKTPKAPKEKLTLADNPSLIQADDEIRLRVLDDFFIEEDLPKWKQFNADWKALKEQLKIDYADQAERAIKAVEDPKLQEEYQKRLASYKRNKKKLDDDRYNIREKHETAVENSIQKTVRLSAPISLKEKILIKLGIHKPVVPVEVAFEDLKSHLLHTTTEAMLQKKVILDAAEKKFRELGQYNKANQIKAYAAQVIEEQALVAAGFTTYVTEEMMIDFISKSERGVMVDFLRYYDGVIPDDVAELKKKADATMIFDNYVVAYYADFKKVAKVVEKKKKKEKADEVIKARRDPILFGLIKESRKLFFIADWVTEQDDLTLQVLEEAIGKKGLKLNEPDTNDPTVDVHDGSTIIANTASFEREVRNMVNNAIDERAYGNMDVYNYTDSTTPRTFYTTRTIGVA